MRFFQIYQYLAPALLLPLAYALWWQRYQGDHRLACAVLSIPVLFAYIVPALGTNWLGLWEFNTRFRLGRFRPHHGFVFGAATALLTWLVLRPPEMDSPLFAQAGWERQPWAKMALWELGWTWIRDGVLLALVLAVLNTWYDARAIAAGFIRVFTRRSAAGQGPWQVALGYAPIFFGTFGLAYAVALRGLEFLVLARHRWDQAGWWWLGGLAVCLVAPVAAYVVCSWIESGESGLTAYRGNPT